MGYTDESAERLINEKMEKHGFKGSKKAGLFYKKSYENQTHFIDMRQSRMRIYGFESDGETELDRNVMERMYGNIRKELAAIGCADITQFEEVQHMSSRRKEKDEKKGTDLEQRMNDLEEFITGGNDRIKNIDMLVTTIRVQGDHIQQVTNDIKEIMMREGLKNAFLAEKKLQEEFKAFTEKIMTQIEDEKKKAMEPPKQIETNEGPQPVTPADKGIIERKAVNDQ